MSEIRGIKGVLGGSFIPDLLFIRVLLWFNFPL